jgi:trimethylamine:corrinoid methyltransferase-like protein
MHHFLDNPHTIKHLRQEYRFSKIANRLNPEIWMQRGGQDSLDLAAARVKSILQEMPKPRLDLDVINELGTIARAAEESMEDLSSASI